MTTDVSLRLLKAFDLQAYVDAVITASGLGGIGLAAGTFSTSSGGEASCVYLQGRDALYTNGRSTLSPGAGILFRLDPEFALVEGKALAANNSVTSLSLLPGQYNPQTGAQKLYSLGVSFGGTLREVNVDTLIISGASAFTGPNGDFRHDIDIVPDTEGSFSHNTYRSLVFEYLTGGVPGETVQVGTNVYPNGLMLENVNGTVNGNTVNQVWGWLDLYRGTLVGILGGLTPTAFPAIAEGSPSGAQIQSEAPIAGDEFEWSLGGLILDVDATAAQPKGELFMFSDSRPGGSFTPNPGDIARFYLRWSDFNPFGLPSASGVPARTHGRIRLTSRALIPLNPQYDLAGQLSFTNAQSLASAAYDPLRRRVVCTAHNNLNPATRANAHSVGLFSRSVDPVIVTAPAARSVPRTADVTEFGAFVGGDLAEPATGQLVAFGLDRRSTEGELVTVSGGIGTTSQLTHPPVDTDGAGTPELVLVADGIELALTTDYTLVASTGVITWVTSQAGKTVLATYNHRQTGATPAHGTLLTAQAQADENGVVRCEVSYPDDDDIVGGIDAISAELA